MMDPPAPNRKRRRSPVLGSLKSPFVYVPGDGTKVGRFVPRGSGAQYCFPDQPPPPGYEHRRRFIISSRRNPFVLSPKSLCGVGTYSLVEIRSLRGDMGFTKKEKSRKKHGGGTPQKASLLTGNTQRSSFSPQLT
jgi:hypothetical protein